VIIEKVHYPCLRTVRQRDHRAVNLPQIVGGFAFKPFPFLRCLMLQRLDEAMALQHTMNRGHDRQLGKASLYQFRVNGPRPQRGLSTRSFTISDSTFAGTRKTTAAKFRIDGTQQRL